MQLHVHSGKNTSRISDFKTFSVDVKRDQVNVSGVSVKIVIDLGYFCNVNAHCEKNGHFLTFAFGHVTPVCMRSSVNKHHSV